MVCHRQTTLSLNMSKGLVERLQNDGSVLAAEGYIFEFERKGYLKAGTFVPEVVLDHPDLVRSQHEEYVHAGSDVVLAFTYYAHREKLRFIGKEDLLEKMNMDALRIAREVADKTGTLMAGNICNSTVYQRENPTAIEKAREMFKEQVQWAVKGGADFIVAETFSEYGEAALALEVIKQYGQGLPAVVTLSLKTTTFNLVDGTPIGEACRKLEDAGATVVGLNCGRGPPTMIEPLKEIRKACKGPIAAVPVPYRTTEDQPNFFSLRVPGTDKLAFPLDLASCYCTRDEIRTFAKQAKDLGVQYIGLCCGNSSNYFRILAEVYEKIAPANRFAPEMDKHYVFGKSENFLDYYTKDVKQQIFGNIDKP